MLWLNKLNRNLSVGLKFSLNNLVVLWQYDIQLYCTLLRAFAPMSILLSCKLECWVLWNQNQIRQILWDVGRWYDVSENCSLSPFISTCFSSFLRINNPVVLRKGTGNHSRPHSPSHLYATTWVADYLYRSFQRLSTFKALKMYSQNSRVFKMHLNPSSMVSCSYCLIIFPS